jgi:predicted molibdopterin-dependent oxidoreductase YjgC
MASMRITRPSPLLPEVQRGPKVQILVDGRPLEAYEGETIAAALLAAGIWAFRRSARRGEPRGLYCGIGNCFECLVTLDGVHAVRACITPVAPGMVVDTCKEVEL